MIDERTKETMIQHNAPAGGSQHNTQRSPLQWICLYVSTVGKDDYRLFCTDNACSLRGVYRA
jgi:hypothetical protein